MDNLLSQLTIPTNLLFKELSKKELLYIISKTSNVNNMLLTFDVLESIHNFEDFNKIPIKKITENDLKKEDLISYIYDNVLNVSTSDFLILELYRGFPNSLTSKDINIAFNQCIFEILDFKYTSEILDSNFDKIIKQLTEEPKKICKLLFNIILLGKTEKNLRPLAESFGDKLSSFEHEVKSLFLQNIIDLNNYYIDLSYVQFEKLCFKIENVNNKIEKKEKKINTYKDKLKILKFENKNLKKEIKTMHTLVEEICKEEEQKSKNKYEDLIKEKKLTNIKSEKKNSLLEKKNKELLSSVEKYTNKYIKVQETIKEQKVKINNLKEQLNIIAEKEVVARKEEIIIKKERVEYSDNSIDSIIDYIKNNGIDKDLFDKLKPYIDIYYENNLSSFNANNNIVTNKNHKEFGYCTLKEKTIFIVFNDNLIHELKNIPKNVYISEHQFVLVNNRKDCSFLWAYNCKFDTLFSISQSYVFASIEKRGKEYFVSKDGTILEKLTNMNKNAILSNQQIIAMNVLDNKFIRYYKTFKPLVNDFEECMKIKDQTPYFVLKILNNGFFVRNIFTKKEMFFNIEIGNIKEQNIVLMENDTIIKIFQYSIFYTLSPIYENKEFGYINIIDGTYFVKKISGENVILNNVPPTHTFKDGDNVCIDEFNNYLFSETYKKQEAIKYAKKINKNRPSPNKTLDNVIFKDVLIIGKPTYENSYKLALYKSGYKCEVIDGYSSWNKISSAINNKDIIAIDTSYISHDNMWTAKKGINIPIIYCEYDGANRIVQELDDYFK